MKTSSENQLNHVSKKFYRNIIDRVTDVFSTIEIPSSSTGTISAADLAAETIKMIDRYISDGTIAKPSGEMALLAFLMLKPEIDKAADRSRRARQSAARRAQLKQTSATTTIIPTKTSEKTILPTNTNLPPQESDSTSKPTIKERPSSYKTCSSPKTTQHKKPMKKFGVPIVHRHPTHKSRYKKF